MFTILDAELLCDTARTPWCVKPATCQPGYYRHGTDVCVRCVHRCDVRATACTDPGSCWIGFALVGTCTEHSTPQCLKVGRDISEADAQPWPRGNVLPRASQHPA